MENKRFLDIVSMDKLATESLKNNPDVVNGTLGVLKNDDNKLYVYQTVDKIIRNIPNDTLYNYPLVDGGEDFKKNILKWIFKQHINDIINNLYYSVCATPGSVLAVYSTFKMTANPNDKVLIQDIHWSNYKGMIKEANLEIKTFSLFDSNNNFNVNDFIRASEEIIKEQDKLLILINDPSHNPTGFSLEKNEWKEIINYINSLKNRNKEVVLVYDIAYIDYSAPSFDQSRDNLSLITDFLDHVIVGICYSGSKSFSVYGLRMGAQVLLSKKKEVIDSFSTIAPYIGRSVWSVPASPGINLINTLMTDEKLEKAFIDELSLARSILKTRGDIFVNEAKAVGLKHYPYKTGFFISVLCNDSWALREELINNDIHVVPQKGSIRIAISNIPTKKISGLASKIQDALKKINNQTDK